MTAKRTISMSKEEVKRCEILRMAEEKQITQKEGARRIGISQRHFRRILRKYRLKGAEGIISGHRGKPSNNRMSEEKKKKILNKIKTDYEDFGPTFASEKLWERDGIKVSKETVRQIMIEAGLHEPKTKQVDDTHQMRERREKRGELVQIDGSYHAWLEDRAEEACLLVFIDDATSEILAAQFVPTETYFAYADLCKRYFRQHGLPETFYTDRFSVFRVNQTNVTTTDAVTMFERAMKELGIKLICASTPQAKGRVERANQTLQDRLVKEMRLEGINDYKHANEFLAHYLPIHNNKFSVQPKKPIDSHEPLRPENDLELIFTKRNSRILSKNLEFQYNRVVYQIQSDRPTYALKGRKVTVCENEEGKIYVLLGTTQLEFKRFYMQPKRHMVASSKEIDRLTYKPTEDHPWRNYGHRINGKPIPVQD
jgi:predicted DNA-binding protein (UPF0251 family)